ncbi:amylo-alpha-1,6-glucosidase [Pedobacter sp. FW305-3-2-15-E-R2A2]|uniref:amylo-alpha-1,6-glucosidase n=1 Tax=Pedobacter sp. FW305-3-2-15-E-R2A2 TaxID=3140251 RepID=UPI00314022B2
MDELDWQLVRRAEEAAVEVLRYNSIGPYDGLPRTAGWGYPEPYTRDLLISVLGIVLSGDRSLLASVRNVLESLAKNQSPHGHISSLVHDKEDRGASDTTPLFLLATGIFRQCSDEPGFLEPAVLLALTWMEYQRPTDGGLIAQQPTSDWRDEQWVPGYGLFVNTLMYAVYRIFNEHKKAEEILREMNRFSIRQKVQHHYVHEGLALKHKPYYALWSYKVYSSERFDLLGNSMAVLFGMAKLSRGRKMMRWLEGECAAMRRAGLLGPELAPNFFPFIKPDDPDWLPRYEHFNLPGTYHNGGIWPFVCGFHIAALVAVGAFRLAEAQLMELTRMIKRSADKTKNLEFGFNEWLLAKDGQPAGQDWQSWSAAMYLYAARCVKDKKTPFFGEMRKFKG